MEFLWMEIGSNQKTKILMVIMFFMVVRWSWPRFRFDQLMSLAWKVMLPLGLVNFATYAVLDQARAAFQLEGWWWNWVIAALSWLVCIGAWLAVAYAGPLVSDNRPRTDVEPYEIDPQLP